MPLDENRNINRRRFFREGLRELLKPLADAIETASDSISREFSQHTTPHNPWNYTDPTPINKPWLRPPGAMLEQDFLNQCSRCGECVRACPAQCIQLDYTGMNGAGAPYIDPDIMPCVVCDSLACMNVCPTGALIRTERNDINMGTAVWHEAHCLRNQGSDCQICVDRCPFGSAAIELRDNRIEVIEDGCTGCGVCQHECPTIPKSIEVIPVSTLSAPEQPPEGGAD